MELEDIISIRKKALLDELKSADIWAARRIEIIAELGILEEKLIEVADLRKLKPTPEVIL